MSETTGSTRSGVAQSAEVVVTLALLGVCGAAGIAAWLLSGSGAELELSPPAVSASLTTRAEDEAKVLADWQRRIESDFSQREQNLRQQEQSVVLRQQAEALAVAQAAADAAAQAAAAAEARARQAERDRQNAIASAERQQPRQQEPAAAPATAAAAEALESPASIDWSTCSTPDYPRISVRRREEGSVLMSFTVNPSGLSSDGKVLESSGWPRLDDAALDALSKCRFEPGMVAGKPTTTVAQVRFAWELQ